MTAAIVGKGGTLSPVQSVLVQQASGLWWRLALLDKKLGDSWEISPGLTRAYTEGTAALRLVLAQLQPSKPPKPKASPQQGIKFSADGRSVEIVGVMGERKQETK